MKPEKQFDLTQLHNILLEIMLEFDRVCKKHDIKYTIAWGTMLGAIRHGGFIPWDDDVDIIMMRDEYEKFCRVCNDELKSEFFFQSKETDPNYWYNVSRLRKNNTAMIYEQWKNAGFHQGLYIDIQPIDHIADNKFSRALQYFFIILCTPVRMSRNPVMFRDCGQHYSTAVKKVLFAFTKIMPKKLCDRIEKYFLTKHNKKPCKKEGIICDGGTLVHTTRDMVPFESSWVEGYQTVMFEGHQFMIFKNWERFLEHWYGDYMQLPPEEDRVIHHHPLVFDTEKSYEEYLREWNK